MKDREKVIKGLETCRTRVHCKECPYAYDKRANDSYCEAVLHNDALALLKEQEAEIRQLRLALDIAKGTCKGIKSGGGQFADMPTMQSAT